MGCSPKGRIVALPARSGSYPDYAMTIQNQLNIALLIDCENASPKAIHGILSELAEKGVVNIRRAYGNWKKEAGWEEKLHPLAIQPVQQFAYTAGKNAADMSMAIDAMELVYTEKVACFALVTSDSDFTPLVMKLLGKGKQVIGFGESKTPEPFKRACSVFIHTDDFREPTEENPTPQNRKRKDRNELRGDTDLMNALREAIASTRDEDGWSSMQRIGAYITNHSSLSSKNYGYARWTDLVRATEYFDLETRDSNHSYFREKNIAKG